MIDTGFVDTDAEQERMAALGEIVRRARLARGLTQEALAELIDSSQNAISDIERGRSRRPRRELLAALALVLRISEEEIFRAAGELVEVRSARESDFEWGVKTPDFGVVPADDIRWRAAEAEGRTVRAPREWIGTRPPQEFLVVVASCNCLMERGVIAGTSVLLRRYRGEALANGTIVLVNLAGQRVLREFHVRAGAIELRSSAGQVLARLAIDDAYEIVGVHAGHWLVA